MIVIMYLWMAIKFHIIFTFNRKDIPAWCTKQIYYQQLINLNVFTFVISEKKGKKRGGVSSAIPLHPQK